MIWKISVHVRKRKVLLIVCEISRFLLIRLSGIVLRSWLSLSCESSKIAALRISTKHRMLLKGSARIKWVFYFDDVLILERSHLNNLIFGLTTFLIHIFYIYRRCKAMIFGHSFTLYFDIMLSLICWREIWLLIILYCLALFIHSYICFLICWAFKVAILFQ